MDSFNCFNFVLHFAHGHIPPQIAHVFGLAYLLAMTKLLGGVRPIIVRKTLYRFTSHIWCLQFHNTFATNFSPHQFGVATKDSYEVVIHDIKCTLNLHSNYVIFKLDMLNAYNSVSRGAHISRTSCNKWGHPTTHPFCSCILCIWISPILQSLQSWRRCHNHPICHGNLSKWSWGGGGEGDYSL
jgi:hypothetical protein